jgi:glycosyltransferase involved in cell wall biosynthesis
MKSVSVLVPIYNVESFLDECLGSLAKQTLDDIEFICINDGSTDNSLKILKQYAAKDKRFVVIDKSNSGYGDSMNAGLERARGEYIGIVESDDFVDAEMFEKLYALARRTKADVVRSNYYYHHDGIDELHESIRGQKTGCGLGLLDNPEIMFEEPAIWSGLYRREFLNEKGIRFLPTPGASYQDTGFNMKALCSAQRIAYTKKAFLHYRTDNSNSSVKSAKKVHFVRKEYAEIERFLAENEVDLQLRKYAQAAKFGSYHWNLIRLPKKAAKEFLIKMREEYRETKEAGLLEKACFPKKYWSALQVIMRFPAGFYLCVLGLRERIKR